MARRGSGENPVSRFERIETVLEPEEAAAEVDAISRLETRLYDDPTRQILATNQSPDVGFDFSVNPYRGCEHGCTYCLSPGTPVLHTDLEWRPLGDVRVGDVLLGFDETPAPGLTRKLRPAVVEAVWWSRKPTRRLVTGGAEVVTTAEHRWLQERHFRWSRTDQLAPGRMLRELPVFDRERTDDDYRAGYIAGLTLGDGTCRYVPGQRSDKLGFPQAYWRVALSDHAPLERIVAYLAEFGVEAAIRPFDPGRSTVRPMQKVEIRSLARLEVINKLVGVERSSRSYRRGFVAGFYDAEGHNGTSLRMSQVDVDVLRRVQSYCRSLGFEFSLERRENRASTIRLVGSLADRMRFFGVIRPAIFRKMRLFGRMPPTRPVAIDAIEPDRRRDVVDIQTSAGTFFAAGLATHNCYARPNHEFLGFSAGLDFETKILVKRDAPALLRKALSAKRWKPQTIAFSGVTDAYQPAERKLRITRGCLEVLAEFRNPVAIITKNRLVARDADLLGDLARDGAAAVNVSITSLDPALQRVLEPRASAPPQRLAAIESLARAGVPVGVMVAPIIPGLNDHEVPRILEAAAAAGARGAGHIVLRLPHGVKELFSAWLERHFPERRDKVLHRVREVRGGRLNDPRFRTRMRGEGKYAEQIGQLFELSRRRAGLSDERVELSTAAFRRPGGEQMTLF